jgi:uncharacterized protein YndB with AHSA1/START domain
MSERVELQTEVDAPRVDVYPLVASSEGLRRWLDDAEIDPRVGGKVVIRMLEGEAIGEVLAVDPPQHISFSWDWAGEPLGATSVVAFDAIDHGARTHVTVRHVGLPSRRQVELHRSLWEHWLRRFEAATRALPDKVETTHP